MLQAVDVGRNSIDTYQDSAGSDAVEQLRELARPLKGIRVLHVNATPYGGGVAEILRAEIPLLRDLGLEVDWRIITGGEAFFRTTKAMHNGLQGSERDLTDLDRAIYVENAKINAQLQSKEYDLYFVHDPQPMGLLEFHGRGSAKWIWRCHIDTSQPNPDVWDFLRPFLKHYDAAVFTLGGFVPPDLPIDRVEIIPPAIDPLSPKNMELTPDIANGVLQWIGVDPDRPLTAQVSRFDPWKDPLGVIQAYRVAKEQMPDLQLALVGSMALDDPEGWDIYNQIREIGDKDPDLFVFTNLTGVGNIEVNAFQRMADVVIQLSIREGFGLVVSETLWKGTPVVARAAGGIPLQMEGGAGGVLVQSVEDCATHVARLIEHRDEASRLGELGRELVRERFLLTRMIADELRLYTSVLGMRPPRPTPVAMMGLADEIRDPVSGVAVDPAKAIVFVYEGTTYYFQSEECRQQFCEDPVRFLRSTGSWPVVRKDEG
ncbi:MAG: glycosyltransferase [Gemmatimonadales bacterium]|nr:glycosyltransferase [Gemmatimonadales bacterium]NIN10604.1 glycosyltransferase [Gemmatimonadales bacterium]NIN49366.1 glycosyltransferase [Gemmatimonadales bacterium]NIP06830.1 glycosyltransferase [Gemmatimonadales bacterium]NIR01504.1 glycosyltransferase [Gemmatimonadales bacterium]